MEPNLDSDIVMALRFFRIESNLFNMANKIAKARDSLLGIMNNWNITNPDPDRHIIKVARRRLLNPSLNGQSLVIGLHAFV